MVDYRIDPPLDDAALNDLFARAWDDHAAREFAPVLARSLGVVAAFVSDQLFSFIVGPDEYLLRRSVARDSACDANR